jgi:C-6 monooxygenase
MSDQSPVIHVDQGPAIGAGFIAVVTVVVQGPEVQRALVDLLARQVEQWVAYCPGFRSAAYHLSVDGSRVLNYAGWSSEQAYRESFDLNPDKEAMREAIRSLPGVIAGPSMTGYRLDRVVPAVPADFEPGSIAASEPPAGGPHAVAAS